MTNSEAVEILRKELECRKSISRSCVINDCKGCPYEVSPFKATKALEVAIEALGLLVSMERMIKGSYEE